MNNNNNIINTISNIKYISIAIINVFSTNEGKILFKSLLKAIEPTFNLFTNEIILQIKNNKHKIIELFKEFSDPVSKAIRNSMGTIPGFGEVLATYLSLKNIFFSVLNGSNLISTIIETIAINPLSNSIKKLRETIKKLYLLKDESNFLNNEFNNVLKLVCLINNESKKIEQLINKGDNPINLIQNNNNILNNNILNNNNIINNNTQNGGNKYFFNIKNKKYIKNIKNTTRRIKKSIINFFNTK